MRGRIIKGVGGLYSVFCCGEAMLCKARGRFRNQNLRPEVGDEVEFTPPSAGEDYGTINTILPRQNRMTRPSVVNIGLLFVIVSVKDPEPDLMLADKLLLHARQMGIEAELLVNKSDAADPESILTQYRLSGYRPLAVSAANAQGLEELLYRIRDKVCAFCGQSGVGKSSVLNALCRNVRMETGDISRIARGRHTTRHVELIRLEAAGNAWLADTPGFSLLEADVCKPSEFRQWYPEYEPYEKDCRFLGCNHVEEPDCAVKQAVSDNLLSAERRERYARLYRENNEKWSRRYD